MMKQLWIKFLRGGNRVIDYTISILDRDKAKVDFGGYRVELKFFLEENFHQIKGKILDVGSGDWTWTKEMLVSKGCDVISFDKFPHSNVDVVGDIYELSKFFKTNEFDGIICTDVIEHVANPFMAIEQMLFALKPGGYLLFSCPFDKELHGETYGDYWRITRQGWEELLREGCEHISIKWWGHELKPKSYFIKAQKIDKR